MSRSGDPQSSMRAAAPALGEIVPASESAAHAAIVAGIEQRVRQAAAHAPARRDAHPKAHGCVRATFEVIAGLTPRLRAGIFAHPRAFPALIRFSNGSQTPQPDRVGDGRGMAIKLLGVADSASTTQDFLLINHPAFFVRDATDYVAFQAASSPLRFFFPGLNPFRFRLHELAVARAITRREVRNPLDLRYFSMTPFGFGEVACKFAALPRPPASAFTQREGEHFLRANMIRHLSDHGAVFDFMVQIRTDPETMPIEDPTITWSEAESPFVAVATITIPPQIFATDVRDALAEALSFTPWHCIPAHRPLGGINRARLTVYETISRLRHGLNGTARIEPTTLPED